MEKTANEIERDFITFVKNGAIGEEVRGEVLRSEMRKPDAKTEDAVVTFLAGIDGQVQSGTVLINIYANDRRHGGRMVKDHERIGELQRAVNEFVANGGGSEYDLTKKGTPNAYKVDGMDQHVLSAQINFRRITN